MKDMDNEVELALHLIRDLTAKAYMQNIDSRAMRVALKFTLLRDDYLSKENGITPEEDKQLEALAQQLFSQALKNDQKIARARGII